MERPRDKAPIFLGGFMASGKTSVGRELSRMTGYPFLDMDETIEKRTGLSVREIFAVHGEDAFRRMEGELLREVEPLANCIVALGGGVLVDEKNRELVEERGTLVILGVEPDTVRKRTAGQPGLRPLLDENDLEALWAKRLAFYRGGRLRLKTDSISPGQAAREIQEALGLPSPGTGQRVFEGSFGQVVVGAGILDHLPSFLGSGRIPFVVADTLTGPLFGGRLAKTCGLHLLPRGEEAKTLGQVQKLYGALASAGVDRSGTVAALGGGTVGDTAGFAAATWLRGIGLVQCPTTLLAQVDSAIGGKVGVNLPEGKNLVGAFHQPMLVLSDVSCLASLSWKDYRQGLGEVVKYGLGEDFDFFEWIEEHSEDLVERVPAVLAETVGRCTELKLAVVAGDEKETTGSRARLNLGHTIAHALEGATGYKSWQHGDAVAVGLMVSTHLACRLGDCEESILSRLAVLLGKLGLPRKPDLPWEALVPHIALDKKFTTGRPRLVLPVSGSRCRLRDDIGLEMLRESYEEVGRWKSE